MEPFQRVGLVLSVVAAAALVVAWWDIRRRRPFPGFEHGRLRVSGTGMKWVWAAMLLAAFFAGGPEAVSRVTPQGTPQHVAPLEPAPVESPRIRRSAGWEIRLAAYRHSVIDVRVDGSRAHRAERMAVLVPVWLPLALAAYWLVVVRQGPRRRQRWRRREMLPPDEFEQGRAGNGER
jgi:hypothetical protein